MRFVHEDTEFEDLLRIVADERRLSLGLVEKDYWVTHTLWAVHAQGFDVWFKGGTSLSKGFGLIERFSEDLDLKVEPGRVAGVPTVTNWKSEGTKAIAERREYFERLTSTIEVPNASLSLEPIEETWRGANIQVTYPGKHLADLSGVLRPFVLLEVGSARVTPAVQRDLTSFVHAYLERVGQLASFERNLPAAVRCVHPLVTLLEKLDALHRRALNPNAEPATFVRHFEDAARVIAASKDLPALTDYADVRVLASDMLGQKQLAALPSALDAAFTPDDGERWSAIRRAHNAISAMFWGPRIPIDEACEAIRGWVASWYPEQVQAAVPLR
jgi:hypothetical protein